MDLRCGEGAAWEGYICICLENTTAQLYDQPQTPASCLTRRHGERAAYTCGRDDIAPRHSTETPRPPPPY